jgi:chromosome segregation ATPase
VTCPTKDEVCGEKIDKYNTTQQDNLTNIIKQNKAALDKLDDHISQLESQEKDLNNQISKQSLEISALDTWDQCKTDTNKLELEITKCSQDTETINKDRDACQDALNKCNAYLAPYCEKNQSDCTSFWVAPAK